MTGLTHYRVFTKKIEFDGLTRYEAATSYFGPASDRMIGRRHDGLCFMLGDPSTGYAETVEEAIAEATPKDMLPISDDQWLAMDESDRVTAMPFWQA